MNGSVGVERHPRRSAHRSTRRWTAEPRSVRHGWLSARGGLFLAPFLALLVLGMVARVAHADLPGTLPLSAAGDGNLWWVVARSANSAIPAGQKDRSAGDAVEQLLMHHAVVEPAPTERLVIRLPSQPEALAAEGADVVVVMRPEGGRKRMILSMTAVQNPTVGHWYTEPRSGPRILPALEPTGELRAVALAGGVLHALVRLPRESPEAPERLWLGALAGGGGGSWEGRPLPPCDPAEPIRLSSVEGVLHAVGFRDGAMQVSQFAEGAWSPVELRGTVEGASPRSLIGLLDIEGREVLVSRTEPEAEGAASQVRLSFVRRGTIVPWASFPEPAGSWSVAGFGSEAAILTFDDALRGRVQRISPAESAPREAVALAPPGFAARRWVHLPILGMLAIGLSLAALIFGTGGYAERQRVAVVRRVGSGRADDGVSETGDPDFPGTPVFGLAMRPRGAGLAERGTAFAIDLLPGLLAAWVVFGGNPIDLVQVPLFITDLSKAQPALLAFALGWAFAASGDVLFGRSVGKRLLGLSIVDARSGGQASFGQRLVRAALSAIVVAAPIVMLLATMHPAGDGPAEMLSATAVVPEADARGQGGGRAADQGPGAAGNADSPRDRDRP